MAFSRRGFWQRTLGALACAAALGRMAGTATAAPVALNIVDVAGNLALTQKGFEAFRDKYPDLVSRMTFTNAPAPQLPGKIKAMQAAGRADIDIVLTGTDALAAGIQQNLWQRLLPDYSAKLPGVLDKYPPNVRAMQDLSKGYGLTVTFMPAGPLVEYNPAKVTQPPKTPAELLAWCKANPGKLIYARPANSGPGRTFLMGLPYLLGDKDPHDPIKGWDKTWAYLKELGENIDYYPGGTGQTMKELGDGTRDIIVSTTGWDINPRVLGIVPKEAKVQTLKGFHWVTDAQYMMIPKGVSDEKLAVLLDLIRHMLTPQQQAYTYDEGYFYPGPAVKDVPLSMAPESSQKAIAEFGRPEYEKMIADNPMETPLTPEKMVAAFRIWDEQVGGAKKK